MLTDAVSQSQVIEALEKLPTLGRDETGANFLLGRADAVHAWPTDAQRRDEAGTGGQ